MKSGSASGRASSQLWQRAGRGAKGCVRGEIGRGLAAHAAVSAGLGLDCVGRLRASLAAMELAVERAVSLDTWPG